MHALARRRCILSFGELPIVVHQAIRRTPNRSEQANISCFSRPEAYAVNMAHELEELDPDLMFGMKW